MGWPPQRPFSEHYLDHDRLTMAAIDATHGIKKEDEKPPQE